MTARDCWYLVQSKPNSHLLAQRNLARQNFEVFLPMQSLTKIRYSRFVIVQRPLFPGYLFVKCNGCADQMRLISSSLGVCRVVSFGADPARVPSELIAGLQCRFGHDEGYHPRAYLPIGSSVKITAGPLTEFIATVDSIDAEQRVWVLVDILGRDVRIQMDNSALTEV